MNRPVDILIELVSNSEIGALVLADRPVAVFDNALKEIVFSNAMGALVLTGLSEPGTAGKLDPANPLTRQLQHAARQIDDEEKVYRRFRFKREGKTVSIDGELSEIVLSGEDTLLLFVAEPHVNLKRLREHEMARHLIAQFEGAGAALVDDFGLAIAASNGFDEFDPDPDQLEAIAGKAASGGGESDEIEGAGGETRPIRFIPLADGQDRFLAVLTDAALAEAVENKDTSLPPEEDDGEAQTRITSAAIAGGAAAMAAAALGESDGTSNEEGHPAHEGLAAEGGREEASETNLADMVDDSDLAAAEEEDDVDDAEFDSDEPFGETERLEIPANLAGSAGDAVSAALGSETETGNETADAKQSGKADTGVAREDSDRRDENASTISDEYSAFSMRSDAEDEDPIETEQEENRDIDDEVESEADKPRPLLEDWYFADDEGEDPETDERDDVDRDLFEGDAPLRALSDHDAGEAEDETEQATSTEVVSDDPLEVEPAVDDDDRGEPERGQTETAGLIAAGTGAATAVARASGPSHENSDKGHLGSTQSMSDGDPIRFAFTTDDDQVIRSVSPELRGFVGERSGDIAGQRWEAIASKRGFDENGNIAALLQKADTWSGKTVLWPIEDTDMAVPVDLAALPVFGRNRSFEGFRGFGIIRTADAVIDPEARGMLFSGRSMLDQDDEPLEPLAHGNRDAADDDGSSDAQAEPTRDEPKSDGPREGASLEGYAGRLGAALVAGAAGLAAGLGSRKASEETPEEQVETPEVFSDNQDSTTSPDPDQTRSQDASPTSDDSVDGEEMDTGDVEPKLRREGDDANAEDNNGNELEYPISSAWNAARDDETGNESEKGSPANVVDLSARRNGDKDGSRGRLTHREHAAFNEIRRSLTGEETQPDLVERPRDRSSKLGVSTDEQPAEKAPSVSASVQERVSSGGEAIGDGRLLGSLPVPLLIYRSGETLFANDELLKKTGYSSTQELAEAGGIDALFEGDDDLGEGRHQLHLKRQDGSSTPVRSRLTSVDWHGEKALCLTFESTTDQSANEKPALEMMQVAELQNILETAADGIVIVGKDGTVESVNAPGEALFDRSADELAGLAFRNLFADESREIVDQYLSHLEDTGIPGIMNHGQEVLGREANGGFLPLFLTLGKIGNTGRACAVLRDLSNWKKNEEELVKARRSAETASEQKSQFLSRMSHEIREPLNAIIGFSDVMIEERFGPIGNDRYLGYLKDINRSGIHVLDLVNDLLDISKIEAGKLELSYEAVDLNRLAGETVALLQPRANEKRIIIRTSLSRAVPKVVADARSIRQIILNLVSNAINHSPRNSQVIVSTTYEENGEVGLKIRDTGSGMTEAEIKRALEPFAQVGEDRMEKGGGTGLGLPLTKALVEANRAYFDLESKPGEGTIAHIQFPSQRVLAD